VEVGTGLGTALFRLMLQKVAQHPGTDITIYCQDAGKLSFSKRPPLLRFSCQVAGGGGSPVENSPEIVLVVLLKRYFY